MTRWQRYVHLVDTHDETLLPLVAALAGVFVLGLVFGWLT